MKLGPWEDRQAAHRRSRLSHIVRAQQRSDASWVEIPLDALENWRLDDPLPWPAEMLDALVLHIGDNQPSFAEPVSIKPLETSALIGAMITRDSQDANFRWLLEQPSATSLIDNRGVHQSELLLRLTVAGWSKFAEIKRGNSASRFVLMAMKFGDPDLEATVRDCFAPAVARAGFELRVLTDNQAAGLIDDQLRVALRTSRFIVADLTHGSRNAYWEAGFAEGLGRPVIYTCRRDKWEEGRTHFDTNHMATIVWDPSKLEEAAASLTAMVRATLPAEAIMAN